MQHEKSKIYITSNGFIGGHLKEYFKNNLTKNIDEADVVINTIGILREEKYTFEDSHINVVKNLIPKVKDKKFIHISALGSKLNHPAVYKHTKAVAENLIKENLADYAILKPSIVMGKGQKLFEDLEKFKNMPIVLVPKMKVAPIHIDDLARFVKIVIEKNLKGEFSLCGNKVVKMKKLFKYIFKTINKNPIILEMPKVFFGLILPILNSFKILTKDEYLMIEDNICKQNDAKKYLGELKDATKI